MALYELDYDEGIVLQSTSVLLGGATEEEFENIDVIELVITNKRVLYILEISTGFFSKAKTEIKQVPLSNIKVINGVPQVRQVKHDMWGASIQVQFVHGVEYWTLNKKIIPEWVCEINRLLVGEPEHKINTPMPTEDVLMQKQDKKPFIFGTVKDAQKDETDTASQEVSSMMIQTTDGDIPETAIDEVLAETKTEEALSVSVPQGDYANRFCINCGKKLAEGAKFCYECGAPVNGLPIINAATMMQENKQVETAPAVEVAHPLLQQNERKQKYIGTVLKCPHCGGVISETTAVCPDCGMRISGRIAVNSVLAFKEQLMEIEAGRKKSIFGILNVYAAADPVDKKKLTLIQNFPIPNTVDDIIEFIMLAIANIDVSLSKKTLFNSSQGMQVLSIEMPKAISNAWVSKMQQAYQKAEILFPNDPAFSGIQRLYYEKMKELKIKIKK